MPIYLPRDDEYVPGVLGQKKPDKRIVIGLDVGQRSRPSGICVAEIDARREPFADEEHHFVIRRLERLQPGTSYPAVAERLDSIVASIQQRWSSTPTLFANVTGLGEPVAVLFETGKVSLVSCYLNHGDQRTEVHHDRVHIGKAFLVARLQVLLQTKLLHLPQTDETNTLTEELHNYEIRIEEGAGDKPGGFRVGSRDELVTALGLAVQVDSTLRGGVVEIARG